MKKGILLHRLVLWFAFAGFIAACAAFPTPKAQNTAIPAPTVTSRPPSFFDLNSQAGDEEAYRLRLRVHTTSDWTRIIFNNAVIAVTEAEILQGAEAPELQIVRQPEIVISKHGGNQTPVEVEFVVYLSPFGDDSLNFAIGKGHIGTTSVDIFNFNGAEPQGVASYSYSGAGNPDDPLNRLYYNVSAEKLTEGGPFFLGARAYPKTVLAFYYPWYGLPEGPSGRMRVWDQTPPVRTPAGGYYDVYDPEWVRQQIRDAKSAGIGGFVVSWWGIDHFSDTALREVILPVAEEERFAITIYYEHYQQPRVQIPRDFEYITDEYSGSPAFMRVDGEPVIFVYDLTIKAFSEEDWRWVFQQLADQDLDCFCVTDGLAASFHLGDARFDFLFDLFDGIHTYSPLPYDMEFLQELYASGALRAAASEMLFAATVAPGADNSSWAPAPGKEVFVVDRQDGELYRQMWQAATSVDPEWILITSYNEWPEGTEIEPSEELGHQYLEITRQLVDGWK